MIIITRKKNIFGYYAKGRWKNQNNEKTDELAINPSMFNKYPLIEILQTMGHEMCHLWQEHFGTPSRRTYHNKEWSEKMISIGLMPSNTGEAGGKTTGQQMMEYPIKNGLFLKVCENLITDHIFSKLWFDISINKSIEVEMSDEVSLSSVMVNDNSETIVEDPSKKKYQCPKCHINVWGKVNLYLVCGSCSEDFVEL